MLLEYVVRSNSSRKALIYRLNSKGFMKFVDCPFPSATHPSSPGLQSYLVPLFFLLVLVSNLSHAHEGEDHTGDDVSRRGSPFNMSGDLEVEVADHFDKNHSLIRYYIRDIRGRRFRVFFESDPGSIKAGDKVKIRGKKAEQVEDIFVPAGDGSVTVTAPAEIAEAVTGTRKILVMRIAMPGTSPIACSTTNIAELLFTGTSNLSGMYRAASYAAFSFNGDGNNDGTPDVIDVSISNTVGSTCDNTTWANAADSAALAKGFNTSNYQHRVYVIPGGTPCSWGGYGSIGGSAPRTWVNGAYCQYVDIYAHELGHNIGMHHASGNGDEYGDISCLMGRSGFGYRFFNAPHAMQMGWIQSYDFATLSSGCAQRFTLNALEATPTNDTFRKVVMLPSADGKTKYYISYRARIGPYSTGLNANYDRTTNIHTFEGTSANWTYHLAALSDGQTFSNATDKIEVRQLSHSDANTSAEIEINYNCSAGALPGVPQQILLQ